MKKGLNWMFTFPMVVAITLVVAACGPTAPPMATKPAPKKTEETLTVAIRANPGPLEPLRVESAAMFIVPQIFETLLERDTKGDLKPGLAESWKQQDEVNYVFNLRKGVRFHNGAEMTAIDVKYVLDMIGGVVKPAYEVPGGLRWYGYIPAISKAETVDDYTVRLTLKEPFGSLLNYLAAPFTGVFPVGEAEKWGKDFGRHPVGTGPFKFVEWVDDVRVVLVRNEDYWRTKAPLAKVVLRIIPEDATSIAELRAGQVDVIHEASPVQWDLLKDDPKYKVISEPTNRALSILFNLRRWPFSDRGAREVVYRVFDFDAALPKLFPGQPRAYSSFVEGGIGYEPNFRNLLPKFDMDKARELVAAAKAKQAFVKPIRFLAYMGYGRDALATYLATQLQSAGMPVALEVLQPTIAAKELQKKDFDLFAVSLELNLVDPHDAAFLYLFSRSGISREVDPGSNHGGYNNPKVDELIKKGQAASDAKQRAAIYQEIQKIAFADDLALIPVTQIIFRHIAIKGLDGWVSIPSSPNNTDFLRNVTLQR